MNEREGDEREGEGEAEGEGEVSEVPGKVGKSANDFSFRRPDPLEFSIERDSKIYIYICVCVYRGSWKEGKNESLLSSCSLFFCFFPLLNRVF